MKPNQKTALIDEMLTDIVEIILAKSDNYFASNFDLKEVTIANKAFRAKASKLITKILSERKEQGMKNSEFNDELFDQLIDGKTIVWTDVTGVLLEDDYDKEITRIENEEGNVSSIMKEDFVKRITKAFSVRNDVLDGNVFSTNIVNLILLPKTISNLELYEAEDIYDYMEVEITANVADFYVCNPINGIKFKYTGNRQGKVVSLKGKTILTVTLDTNDRINPVNGKLFISEDDIGE